MYHTMAYTTLIGTVANTDIPALQDDIIAIQNTHFILPAPMKLFAGLVTSPTAINAQLVSPTLRQINPVFFRPVNLNALPPGNPGVFYAFGGGLQLSAFEETQVLGTAAPATTERFTAVLFAGDTPTPNPQGPVYVCQFTSTGTATANVWTTIPYGYTNVLPSGIYTMVQSELFSTNGIAHRWIFSGQYWRPGFPSMQAAGNRLPDQLLYDWLGMMGTFRSNDLPRLQVLANAADAVHTGYAWLVRTGNLVP
jgi:hypothetical protein